ncbi:fimbrial protein [[Haemophilus] ducreyi]|uniref:Flp family type IVb pilin n=1 Tax=Haemophilus ducreyi TaxID=730 RepID=UPI000654F066|nr:fimbrial protein [[Haemophilus] ducreyi]
MLITIITKPYLSMKETLISWFNCFRKNQQGVTAIEYGLIAVAVAILIIAVFYGVTAIEYGLIAVAVAILIIAVFYNDEGFLMKLKTKFSELASGISSANGSTSLNNFKSR